MARAASAHRATLIVLAMRTDRHQRIGRQRAVGAVEREVQVLARIADLAAEQRLTADAGMRDEPSPPSASPGGGRAGVSPRFACPPLRHGGRRRARVAGRYGRGIEETPMAPSAPAIRAGPMTNLPSRAVHRVVAGQRLVTARRALREQSFVRRLRRRPRGAAGGSDTVASALVEAWQGRRVGDEPR